MRYFLALIGCGLILFLFNPSALASTDGSRSNISSFAPPTPAVEYDLPFAGLLPDHPLYLLKASRDRILLFFTHDPVKNLQLKLLFADKRLVMGRLLWEKGSYDLSTSTFIKAEKYLLTTSLDLGMLKKQNNLPPGLTDKLESAAKKHEELIMQQFITITDETQKQNLNQALGINHQAMQQIILSKQQNNKFE